MEEDIYRRLKNKTHLFGMIFKKYELFFVPNHDKDKIRRRYFTEFID